MRLGKDRNARKSRHSIVERLPVVGVDPRVDPDWTSRNWENEARTASAALKDYPLLSGNRVTYYLVYATSYLMTSEGTIIRTSRHLAAIEVGMDTEADDGPGDPPTSRA